MNFKLVVTSFCFLSLIYWAKCQTESYENIQEAGRAVKLITKTTAALDESVHTSFFKDAKAMAKQLANLLQDFNNMVIFGIYFLNSLQTEKTQKEAIQIKKIKEQFIVVNGKLQSLEKQINPVSIVFQGETVKTKLSEFLDMRERIMDMLDSFSQNPNKLTTDQLKQVCATNSMRDLITFLNSQIMNGGEESLIEAMKRDHKRKAFFKWTKNVYGMFVVASVLHNICYTATYVNVFNEEALNTTLVSSNENFQAMLNEITNKLENEHNEFFKLENYMKWVEHDLREQMRINAEMSHKLFSVYMKLFLAEKYDWRSWIVGSYDGDTETFDQHGHTLSDYSIQVFREENRCVFVQSMKNYENDVNKRKEMVKWGSAIRNYVLWEGPHGYFSNEKCKNILDIIGARYSSAHIVCVDSGKHMQFAASPGALYTSFSVTTFKADGKTSTFPNQADCDKWVHHNYRGGYPGGLATIPEECYGKSMNIIVTDLVG